MSGNLGEFPVRLLGLRRLGGNVAATLLRQVLALVIGFGLSVFFARTLGPQGNGLYALVVLLPTLLSIFANLGVGPANVYFLGRGGYGSGEVARSSVLLAGVLSLLGIILAIPLLLVWGGKLFPGVGRELLVIGLAIFPFMLAQSLLLNVFQGRQDFRRFNSLGLVALVATLLLAFLLVGIFKLGVFGAVVSFGLGQLTALFFTLQTLRREIFDGTGNKGYIRACLGYGWKAYFSNVLTFLNYRLDIFLVNGFLNPAAAGVYVIAVQIGERLWILSQAVSTVLLPRLAELDADERVRVRLTPLISRWVFFIMTLVALVIAMFAQPLIVFLFGGAYREAVGALLWLLPGVTLGSMSRILANDLAARGRPELNLYTAGMILLLTIAGNTLLIPQMGIEGAALASTIAYGVDSVVKVYQYRALSKNLWFAALVPSRSDLIYARAALRYVARLLRRG